MIDALGPINLIFVVGNLSVNGPNMQLLYLCRGMNRSKFRLTVFSTTQSPTTSFIQNELANCGIEIVELEGGKLSSLFAAPIILRKLFQRRPRTIIHPYGFRSDVITFFSYCRPKIGHVQNNLLHNYKQMFGPVLGRIIANINLWFLARTQSTVSCGESVRQDLKRLGLDSIVIRNAIEPEVYRRLFASGTHRARQRGCSKKYLTVSSSIPGKNVEFLLERFAEFRSSDRSIDVIGNAAAELVSKYRDVPNIKFLGHIAQPADAFGDADFFVSASTHEGMPNAVIESLTMGRPVLLSNIPAHQEILSSANENVGFLFTLNKDSFLDAIAKIESLDQREAEVASLNFVTSEFSSQAMVSAYEQFYSALLNN
ncbi:MAG: glycosyltransferase [Parvibaculaceae bacterium]|nr:glycosyltransferase [Parvibaculaceae bacterium]